MRKQLTLARKRNEFFLLRLPQERYIEYSSMCTYHIQLDCGGFNILLIYLLSLGSWALVYPWLCNCVYRWEQVLIDYASYSVSEQSLCMLGGNALGPPVGLTFVVTSSLCLTFLGLLSLFSIKVAMFCAIYVCLLISLN